MAISVGTPLYYLEYTTIEGDTFDTLALDFYDEERMSTFIMQYNPDYLDYLIFPANVKLTIPIYEEAMSVDSLPPWRK